MSTSAGRARIPRRATAVAAAALLASLAALLDPPAAGARPSPVEHVRGIYLQRAIELATVGTRTVLITRMTRFWRCGSRRGTAEEFNDHLVDVAGREVADLGFVAGIVDSIDGCTPAAGRSRGTAE